MKMKTPFLAALALGNLLAPALPAHADPDPAKLKAGARVSPGTARASASRPTPPPYPLELRVLERGTANPARVLRATDGQALSVELELVNRGTATSFTLGGVTLGLNVRVSPSVTVKQGETTRIPVSLTPRDCARHPRSFLQLVARPNGVAAIPASIRVGVRCK
jgi:hypothetical protein